MSLNRGKTVNISLDCMGSRTMLWRKSNVNFIFFLMASSSEEWLMNATASLHSSSLKMVSGLNSDCLFTVGPPDPASADVPCPD